VPKNYSLDPQLGSWVHRQRSYFKNGILDPERKRRLDEIGFDFNPKDKKTNEKNWNLQFKKLRDYYVKHGPCELVWDVDRFIFVLSIDSNTPTHLSLSFYCR
jgi:hypothetical protein